MDQFWNALTILERGYLLAAIGGGTGFFFSVIVQFMGGDSDVSADSSVDLDNVSSHDGMSDSDVSFKLMSFLGLTTFFTMFGLVGLALSKAGQLSPVWSILGGFAAGGINIAVMKGIFSMFKKLQSTGKSSN
ncbi:MAG: hypothetical protein COW00_17985 [Bdellovibrio sp. CG12_big_fil_rev_8_21_14_0_65_39_13]|nr:MAG: hypothetical protein COW00_17985 [Bdellovibrio sp. CG12_big_fil_rev_8_21_14_0_65_39_13]PIR36909.1 MAG: hypothetical protein COV37_00015 [Bdellovibrio sp. CG11_big_fil_rev_8_21_14_0_20_39_38]